MNKFPVLKKKLYNKAIYYEGSEPSGLLVQAGDAIVELTKAHNEMKEKVLDEGWILEVLEKYKPGNKGGCDDCELCDAGVLEIKNELTAKLKELL